MFDFLFYEYEKEISKVEKDNSLTEEQVLEWVKTQLGATELLRITTIGYDYVANQLTTIEDRGLPWENTTSTNETTTI